MFNILIKDLEFSYSKEQKILSGINMEAKAGDFVCLLGQSGCGKSTLLRLLAGIEKPDAGEILVNGFPIQKAGVDRGVVFQDYGLFPWMSIGENISIGIKHKYPDLSKKERRQMASEWLEKVGLERKIYDKLPKDVSGGQKQRCGIARAFAMDSPILLMDEPFGALDAVTKAKLQNLVLELWVKSEPKKTVFFVTHDVDEALLLATSIFVLSQSPAAILYHHEFDADCRPTRENMYTNLEVMQLRTELIRLLHQDAQERVMF